MCFARTARPSRRRRDPSLLRSPGHRSMLRREKILNLPCGQLLPRLGGLRIATGDRAGPPWAGGPNGIAERAGPPGGVRGRPAGPLRALRCVHDHVPLVDWEVDRRDNFAAGPSRVRRTMAAFPTASPCLLGPAWDQPWPHPGHPVPTLQVFFGKKARGPPGRRGLLPNHRSSRETSGPGGPKLQISPGRAVLLGRFSRKSSMMPCRTAARQFPVGHRFQGAPCGPKKSSRPGFYQNHCQHGPISLFRPPFGGHHRKRMFLPLPNPVS